MSPGEQIVINWHRKYGNNPALIRILSEGLSTLKAETAELSNLLQKNQKEEVAEVLHRMKGFPGGFGLSGIDQKIKLMESCLVVNSPDKTQFKMVLEELNTLLDSIPEPSDYSPGEVNREDPIPDNPCGPTVLVADDDQMNAELIQISVEEMGFDCTIVNNGKEALQVLANHRFDLLYLDIQMPVMDGIETIRKIREVKHLDNLAVIAITANSEEDYATYSDFGFDDVISKPIDIDLLATKMHSALNQRA